MSDEIVNFPAGTLADESKMDKLRGRFSAEFLNDLTERIITGLGGGVEERFRVEIAKVRAANHDPIFMEILMARKNMLLDDAIRHIGKMVEVSEADDGEIDRLKAGVRLLDQLLEYHDEKSSAVAKSGGDGRAAKIKALEDETIRLYKLGPDGDAWPTGKSHAPTAALEITPKVVAFSKGRGNLLRTTTKPLEWIRAHLKAVKK
ncbi:hypothetical protein [Massilia sp. PWRC2]|uniref:hypothetical protein n=1 Tax=Massilia sp. PWRC2 TaxID=2804626 RepID=UPI003CF2CE6C